MIEQQASLAGSLKRAAFLLALILAGVAAAPLPLPRTSFGAKNSMPIPGDQPQMENLIPSSVRGWSVAGTPTHHPGMQIFDYMDGAGEIYRAYDFRDLLVAHYEQKGEEEILLEIFDMGSAARAFGVFTYMRGRGPGVSIGQEGEYKSGLLSFWKGRYFVCVKTDSPTASAKEAVLELGGECARRIGEVGELPPILNCMPEGEYVPESLRYFFRDEILNIHYSIGDGNVLLLGKDTEGVLARMKSDRSMLLLLRYPNGEASASALERFRQKYRPMIGSGGAVRTGDRRWTVCRQTGRHVILVFDAPEEKRGEEITDSVSRRLP